MDDGHQDLSRECELFGLYLADLKPDPYIVQKYCDAHKLGQPTGILQEGSFDSFLFYFTKKHTWSLRLVDSYCSMFFVDAWLRKKLVLLLAILEGAPTSFRIIDRPIGRGKVEFFVKLCGHGAVFFVTALIAVLCMMPIQFLFFLKTKVSQ